MCISLYSTTGLRWKICKLQYFIQFVNSNFLQDLVEKAKLSISKLAALLKPWQKPWQLAPEQQVPRSVHPWPVDSLPQEEKKTSTSKISDLLYEIRNELKRQKMLNYIGQKRCNAPLKLKHLASMLQCKGTQWEFNSVCSMLALNYINNHSLYSLCGNKSGSKKLSCSINCN